jgi:hypothetical protein
MSFATHQRRTITAPAVNVSKEITISRGEFTQVILVPDWWSTATTITAVVNAVVKSGETFRSVNTNDIVKFTIDWHHCNEGDYVMLLDVNVDWKEVK